MRFPTFLKSMLLGVPVGVTLLDCIGYVARVEGVSMQPALNPDAAVTDYVFLSRWAVRNMDVQRGDIISLISPKDPSQKIIKRIVALQGDVISTLGYKVQYVKVPEGHCWIEGDHTGNSLDSNTFGPVSLGLITARATQIVWPPSRWQQLPSTVPKTRTPISFGKRAATGSNGSHGVSNHTATSSPGSITTPVVNSVEEMHELNH
ncbi:mitochondrial inner membrane protease subunit 2 [Anopheles ziemanni]|uniref:mitochondrial inner membrane protease subunit 2 n=1 Tax=Anopheles coustani TaxID=139045 RepID=UPI00265B1691|nr:mitochondrial inner membrane protease subunit 2 [Anopheles coustani]XP_058166648.1 mitochondrial inner membrane protease subunit 2 [Anopheles ziemanni]